MRAFVFAAVTMVSSATVFTACSGESGGGPSVALTDGGSSGSSDSSGSSGSSGATDNAACSAIAQTGTSVDVKAAKPPEPTATGGTPVDGTFVLTSMRAFTTLFAEGNTVQAFGSYTLTLKGTEFEQVVTNKDNLITRAKGSLVVDGVNFTATPDCEVPVPDGGPVVIAGTFTADATTLKLYIVRDFGITAELLFEKR